MNNPSQLYEIELKNCSFYAYHGAFQEEKKIGQRFYVDATLNVVSRGALQNDDIAGTVHYGEVFKMIERIITNSNRNLIETLAFDIATKLCQEFTQIQSTKITIRKPSAPVSGILDYVEVTVCYPEEQKV